MAGGIDLALRKVSSVENRQMLNFIFQRFVKIFNLRSFLWSGIRKKKEKESRVADSSDGAECDLSELRQGAFYTQGEKLEPT